MRARSWVALALALSGSACVHREARRLGSDSRRLGHDVARGGEQDVLGHVVPGARASVDARAMTQGSARRALGKTLRKPKEVQPDAVVLVAPGHAVRAEWSKDGWRFAEDPTDLYGRATPRQALRALVWASRHKRWDVLVQLAPQRYRVGLSEDDLARAWTQGDWAKALRAARDRVAAHLDDPIPADAHEATLDLGEGHVARLEREGESWVIVEF